MKGSLHGMDENIDKQRIEEALKRAGVDLDRGRFEVEASHLSTLFLQGKTIAQALETVEDKAMLQELRPYMYGVALYALIGGVRAADIITAEQAADIQDFVQEICDIGPR